MDLPVLALWDNEDYDVNSKVMVLIVLRLCMSKKIAIGDAMTLIRTRCSRVEKRSYGIIVTHAVVESPS
jgi:hypothetical protein